MYCQIDWSRLDRITPYTLTPTELAAPEGEPILLAEIYHEVSMERQVELARKSEPVKINWINTLHTDEAVEFQRIPVIVR